MFVTRVHQGGQIYLVLMESFYDQKTGKHKKRIIKRFGNIKKISPEQEASLREQYREARDNLPQAKVQETLQQLKVATAASTGNRGFVPKLKLAHLMLRPLWEDELQLDYHLHNLAKRHGIGYDPAAIASFLTTIKMVQPTSHLKAAHRQTNRYLGNAMGGASLDDVYRCLGFLAEHQESIMRHVAHRIRTLHPGSIQLFFYDCTNCYFETPHSDKEWAEIRAYRWLRRVLRARLGPEISAKYTDSQLDEALNTEEYRCVLDEIRKQCSTPFRMRGHQKEMRYDLPMVYVALVIDEHGLPLDFQCYPGNSSEQKTMVESIRKLKEKYDFKHAVLVADNGLNSTANLRMLLSEGLGFSVAQSVYTLPRDCIDAHLRDLKAFSPIPGEPELRYKLVPYEKTSYIRDEATGEREKVSVSCHLLLTYSEERRQHDLAVLNRHIEQARRYIQEAASALNAAPGSHQFCVADCNDGEIRYTGLNYALIEKYRRLAGFSGVLFQEPPDFKDSFEPGYVASLYHKLVRIEECFRIMKNNFEIRPMYVWTEPHIKGHVLLCVLALLQLRLLQQRMEEKQTPLNINDLCAELSDLEIGVVPTIL
mgnify:FL=1